MSSNITIYTCNISNKFIKLTLSKQDSTNVQYIALPKHTITISLPHYPISPSVRAHWSWHLQSSSFSLALATCHLLDTCNQFTLHYWLSQEHHQLPPSQCQQCHSARDSARELVHYVNVACNIILTFYFAGS